MPPTRHVPPAGSRRCQPVPVEVRRTADLLERRWQLSIIYAALTGALRFSEFAEAVSGISPRMLSERLRDLEAAGLVQRTVIPSSPPRSSTASPRAGGAWRRWSKRCGLTPRGRADKAP